MVVLRPLFPWQQPVIYLQSSLILHHSYHLSEQLSDGSPLQELLLLVLQLYLLIECWHPVVFKLQ